MLPVINYGLDINFQIFSTILTSNNMNEGGGTSPDGLYDDPLEEDSFLAGLDDAIMNQPHIKGLFLTAYILVFLFCVFGRDGVDIWKLLFF